MPFVIDKIDDHGPDDSAAPEITQSSMGCLDRIPNMAAPVIM
jgi:hypothetical protein